VACPAPGASIGPLSQVYWPPKMKTPDRYTFEKELGAPELKKYLSHPFTVAEGAIRLAVRFHYEPLQAEGQNNLLTLSLFDPRGFRGTGHRNGPDQEVEIGFSLATPGYVAGEIPAGTWSAEVATHWFHPGLPCRYRLDIQICREDSPSAPARKEMVWHQAGSRRRAGWFRGDLHAHTNHSDGEWDVEALVRNARSHRLDFIALTDHNTTSGLEEFGRYLAPDLLTIPAMESTTYWGHALNLGVRRWLDWRVGLNGRTISHIFEETASASGLFIIAHPVDEEDALCAGCVWRYREIMPGPAHGVEIWNGQWNMMSEQSLSLWYEWLNRGCRIPATAGTDAHGPECYSNSLQRNIAINYVKADRLSQGEILEAIRRGRLYLSAGPRVELAGVDGGGNVLGMGDTLAAGVKGLEVIWQDCPGRARFRLIADGKAQEEWTPAASGRRSWSLGNPAYQWCTVELRAASGKMLTVTNPIYFTQPPSRRL